MQDNGTDPVTGEALSAEDLVAVKTNKVGEHDAPLLDLIDMFWVASETLIVCDFKLFMECQSFDCRLWNQGLCKQQAFRACLDSFKM